MEKNDFELHLYFKNGRRQKNRDERDTDSQSEKHSKWLESPFVASLSNHEWALRLSNPYPSASLDG
ncbi:MAG: hypothetical protein LBD67_05965 [Candidatus Accumulibacter sp.]|jgi:hypothetical protein|nr:hypothetical protein [Accumulibacter sp.]